MDGPELTGGKIESCLIESFSYIIITYEHFGKGLLK